MAWNDIVNLVICGILITTPSLVDSPPPIPLAPPELSILDDPGYDLNRGLVAHLAVSMPSEEHVRLEPGCSPERSSGGGQWLKQNRIQPAGNATGSEMGHAMRRYLSGCVTRRGRSSHGRGRRRTRPSTASSSRHRPCRQPSVSLASGTTSCWWMTCERSPSTCMRGSTDRAGG